MPTTQRTLTLLIATTALAASRANYAQTNAVHNRTGIQMTVDPEDHDPAVAVTLPGNGPARDRTFKVLLPEHLTVRKSGQAEATHLYIFQPGTQPSSPHWQQTGNTLGYTANFGPIQLHASATLADDGLLFRYDLVNHSATPYDMATAITDPRFGTIFHDPRLDRTFVHFPSGFALLAAETPERLTLPLSDWFPVRYHAQFTAPVPAERTQHSDDGVTRRYASQRVDLPAIATVSADGQWIAASFSRDPGNVWSNPELTCQHVDMQQPLPANGEAHLAVKILLLHSSTLPDVLRQVQAQRQTLP